MFRNYCQAAASVVSALTIVAAQNRQPVTFKSAVSIHKLVTTSSDPSCRCRIQSCDMFGGKQRAAMLALIIAAMLYSTLLYVCGRYTARYAAQRGRSKTRGSCWAACSIHFHILRWHFCRPMAK
jgi:hypothetical protein